MGPIEMTKDELIRILTKKDGRCFLSVNDKKHAHNFDLLTRSYSF